MKKRVQSFILEDMERYIEDFNPDDYEKSEYTDFSVIRYVRDYYDTHLPVDVMAWYCVNKPSSNLLYASGLGDQVYFVLDTINRLLRTTYEEWDNNKPLVISTHYSKSVKLPVYQINLEQYGIEIILRENFYDWKVSIKSDKPLDFDFMGIFNPTEKISALYCQGIPKDKVYGSYEQNHSQFTIEIKNDYDLYTFFFLLKNYLGIKKEN